ncbi:MAG: hypothetical protein ACP5JP_10200 [bacterium]
MKYDNQYPVIKREGNYKRYIRVIALWMVMLIGLNACGPVIRRNDLGGEDFKGASMQPLTYDPESHWTRQTKDKITVMVRYWIGTISDVPSKVQYPPAFEIGVINESDDPLAISNNFIYLSDGSKPLPEVDINPPERTDFCWYGHHFFYMDINATDCDVGSMGILIFPLPAIFPCLLYDIPKCHHIYSKNLDKFNARIASMNNLLLHDTTVQPTGTADGWVYFNSVPSSGTLTISLRDTKTNMLETFVFNLGQ